MNKILLIILVVILTGCATSPPKIIPSENASSIDYFKETYFNKMNLDPVEGIWLLDMIETLGHYTFAIIKNNTGKDKEYDYVGIMIKDSFGCNSPGERVMRLKKRHQMTVEKLSGVFNWSPPLYKSSSSCVSYATNVRIVLSYDIPYIVFINGVRGGDEFHLERLYPATNQALQISSEGDNINGTGFFINKEGYILTNHHVIENCKKPGVIYNGEQIDAPLSVQDKAIDLAVLKINKKNTSFIKINDSPSKKLQRIIAAGYPFGKSLNDDLKFTSGIISSLKGPEDNSNIIQIDAVLNFGNSGGPIVDEKTGDLVGVAVSGIRNEAVEGINFGIKSRAVINFLETNSINYNVSTYSLGIDNVKLSKLLEETTVYVTCNQ